MEADLVLVDCNVVTMNPSHPTAEAIAIKKDRIVKVGKREELDRFIGTKTKKIELNGLTVIPGLIDTHLHISDFGRFLTWLDLKNVDSIKKMQVIINRRRSQIQKGKWILGQGWDQTNFVEKRIPNLQDLDEVAVDNPVILYHRSGCFCVVNTKALESAGLTKETKSPLGGKIEIDQKTGDLTGVLRENAMNLVWEVIPQPDEEEVFQATILACEKIVEAGITSVHWIISSLSEIKLIQRLREKRKLPLRVYIIFPVSIMDQIADFWEQQDLNDDWVKFGGVIIFSDGSIAERTAALKEPYNDDSKTKGSLCYSQEEFRKLVTELHQNNFYLVIHAMGDHAIEMTLKTLENILKKHPKRDHRYRIEQASILNRELIRRIKKLELIVSVQPCTVISEFTSWSAIERLGIQRARWLYPLKELIKENTLLIGGSDCPMEQLNPFLGIQAAATRKFFPENQIPNDEALKMYTTNAAYASFDENIKGSIDKGKFADLIVISNDPRTTHPNKIDKIKVNMTIIGGKIVYTK